MLIKAIAEKYEIKYIDGDISDVLRSDTIYNSIFAGNKQKQNLAIECAIKNTPDNIIIIGSNSAYSDVVKQYGGQVIELKTNGTDCINPMEMFNKTQVDEVDFFIERIMFLMELLNDECRTPKVRSEIFDILREIYKNNKDSEQITLCDLRKENVSKEIETAIKFAKELPILQKSNISFNNKIIYYNIHAMTVRQKSVMALVAITDAWGRAISARHDGKESRIFIEDLADITLSNGHGENYSQIKIPLLETLLDIYKRGRLYGTAITILSTNDGLQGMHNEALKDKEDENMASIYIRAILNLTSQIYTL